MKKIPASQLHYNIDIDTKHIVKMPLNVMDKNLGHIANCYKHDIVVLGASGDYQSELMGIGFDIPNNVYKIYCQGINFTHEKVNPIPLGIQEPHSENIDETERRSYDKLCFMNFQIATNPHVRGLVAQQCRELDFVEEIEMRAGLKDGEPAPKEYMINLYSKMTEYKFGISPIGNGLDCYRTWEYLYLGIIPIVYDMPMNRYFSKEVPMILVTSYGELTETMLNKEYNRIQNTKWNWDFLTQDYYEGLVLQDIENLTKTNSLV